MNDTSATQRSGYRTWAIIVMVGVLGYALCWGPVLWLLHYGNYRPGDTGWRVVTIAFHPHFWAMYQSERYFSYSLWWGKLGDPRLGNVQHEEYRNRFETLSDA
jgi:hypothetical protein